jgi:hypothetical protein
MTFRAESWLLMNHGCRHRFSPNIPQRIGDGQVWTVGIATAKKPAASAVDLKLLALDLEVLP